MVQASKSGKLDLVWMLEGSDDPLSAPMRFLDAYQARWRRVVRTRQGYIGLAPLAAQAGDEVWAFQTSRAPYLLRAREGYASFELLGEAYVHGKMYEVSDEVEKAMQRDTSDFDWDWVTLE